MSVNIRSIKESKSDRAFSIVNMVLLILTLLVTAYPLIYVLSSSFSSPIAVISGKVWLFPVDFSLEGYSTVFRSKQIWNGYLNSFYYTIVGTIINVVLTVMAAYPLSRRDFHGRNIIMFLFTFTMFFNGGLIPTYLLVRDLNMINTRWAMWIPNAMAVWNVILTRTYFQNSIPSELYEAAAIDGCNNRRFIIQIVLPLSKPIIAVISLFYVVGHWNAFFNALIYLKDAKLYPLQIILRSILIQNQVDNTMMIDVKAEEAKQFLAALLKYSLIIVASLPVLVAYPFVQKHFVKGVMIGAIKG